MARGRAARMNLIGADMIWLESESAADGEEGFMIITFVVVVGDYGV